VKRKYTDTPSREVPCNCYYFTVYVLSFTLMPWHWLHQNRDVLGKEMKEKIFNYIQKVGLCYINDCSEEIRVCLEPFLIAIYSWRVRFRI
jgi:hypothetical protein